MQKAFLFSRPNRDFRIGEKHTTEERRRRPAELWGALWVGVLLIGLGILFYYDIFWPGILILIGILMLIGGIIEWTTGGR